MATVALIAKVLMWNCMEALWRKCTEITAATNRASVTKPHDRQALQYIAVLRCVSHGALLWTQHSWSIQPVRAPSAGAVRIYAGSVDQAPAGAL